MVGFIFGLLHIAHLTLALNFYVHEEAQENNASNFLYCSLKEIRYGRRTFLSGTPGLIQGFSEYSGCVKDLC